MFLRELKSSINCKQANRELYQWQKPRELLHVYTRRVLVDVGLWNASSPCVGGETDSVVHYASFTVRMMHAFASNSYACCGCVRFLSIPVEVIARFADPLLC